MLTIDSQKAATNRTWFVRDQRTGHGVWVSAGPGYDPIMDGESDHFSDRDVSVRQFHLDEDERWLFGAGGDLEYKDGESIQEQDIVFWYTAHLSHHAALGPAAWITVGPVLKIQR